MVDSMNARRVCSCKKKTNQDFRQYKLDIRHKHNFNNNNVQTSKYFEYFDDTLAKDMNYRQNQYLKIAAAVAMKSVMNHKHGAIIVHKNNIIAVGYNYPYANFSIHAEVAAISQLKGREKEVLPECELYVVRI